MAWISSAKKNNSNENGLVLYYNSASYYSQRVLMALNEKNLKYKSYLVDFQETNSKNYIYNPAFLKINPLGEVPVLKDGVKIIPDSSRIVDYLEDNFSNGAIPRLMPDKGSEEASKVQKFRDEIESISAFVFTFGSMKFPELTKNVKIDEKIIKSLLESRLKRPEILKNLIIKNPEFKKMYSKKLEAVEKSLAQLSEKSLVEEEISRVKSLLDDVETELSSHSQDDSSWWLCSKTFTLADIYLATLLLRVKFIGLSHLFWESPDKYPFLAVYFQKLMTRESVKAVLVNSSSIGSSFVCDRLDFLSIMAITAVATILGSIFLYKRLK
ncbi:Ganglioside-induced differentiation-associated protein 1 [Nymphon striatum]|nr:Ganglioside-induced differentiation-associated protein 1 [Nymphon striatum]